LLNSTHHNANVILSAVGSRVRLFMSNLSHRKT